MSYTELLFDVTNEEEKINDLLDKAHSNFLDLNESIESKDIKVKAYKTVDELDDIEYMESIGYKIKELNHYKKMNLAIAVFLKEGEKKICHQ